MLKWTATVQKCSDNSSEQCMKTPVRVSKTPSSRRKRRATIGGKENFLITSTPMDNSRAKFRNSPGVKGPLTDILNITPESILPSPNRRKSVHSIIPAPIPTPVRIPLQYASTLPKFEEEYSPNGLIAGQRLATRGLLPDRYFGNPRYFTTPEHGVDRANPDLRNVLPNKRKLETAFVENEQLPTDVAKEKTLSSSIMGDLTLDKLIDAILDSTKKDSTKKKKSRRSLNLRRRTLVKNANTSPEIVLSPSYQPGDDPASDLSFSMPKKLKFIDENDFVSSSITNSNNKSSVLRKSLSSSAERNKYFEIGLAMPSIYV